jgi:hypothetical protein
MRCERFVSDVSLAVSATSHEMAFTFAALLEYALVTLA